MVEITAKDTSRWWWFDSHNSSKRSPWLHSTLTELDEKTKAMLKLIEEDADSFALRAEMYYKKRPELISMVEDFYRAHRSLAERYDQVKSETGTRLLTTVGSPFISIKHKQQKLMNVMDQTYYSYSGTSDPDDYAESEVDDPDPEDAIHFDNETEVEDPEVDSVMNEDEGPEWENEIHVDQELKEDSVLSEVCDDDEIMKLREETEEVEDPELENEAHVGKEMKDEEDPEQEDVIQVDQEVKEDSVSSEVCDDEIMRLREETEEVEDPELENEAHVGKEMKDEEDPEQEDVIQVDQELKEDSVSSEVCDDEIMKLREEIETLKEENMMQRNQLIQKDEEKREVIRQLSSAVGALKDENVMLRKYIAARQSPKKQSLFEFSKFKAFFRGTTW
ncbi:hypothetical protein ACOSQ3_000318 [Xanthoceras sorbifolium]